jgi:pyrroline-5-carboxylate reductase
MKRLAIVGAGMMGEALARGLLDSGWAADDLIFCDVIDERLSQIAEATGAATTSDPVEAASQAAGTLIAVKPQDAAAALESIAGNVGRDGLLSIVAGMRTSAIEDKLGHGSSVVRAMPNTPARVGKGVTALAAGSHPTRATRNLGESVFSAVGPVVWLEEDQLDAVTALSGSGPAYVFLLAEMLVDAAVELGLTQQTAETLAFATIEGAGTMLVQTGSEPAVLRQQVTSPGGTTAAAIAVLEDQEIRRIFSEALHAAHARSKELGS